MDMKKKLEKKRQELVTEFERGQQQIQALQKQTNNTVATMQRIQGAIQFCDDEIAELTPEKPKLAKKGKDDPK